MNIKELERLENVSNALRGEYMSADVCNCVAEYDAYKTAYMAFSYASYCYHKSDRNN